MSEMISDQARGPLVFPGGFLWGAASSAHQTEGGNDRSDWWAHETMASSPAREPSRDACRSWTMWERDIDTCCELGLNAYRMSIEWARVVPAPGALDRSAVANYRAMLQALRRRGITVMATLHHFSSPMWFADQGGWCAERAPACFGDYVHLVADALGDCFDLVCSINEPQVVAHVGYVRGEFPPRVIGDEGAEAAATRNFLACHALAAAALAGLPVGMALAVTPVLAADPAEEPAAARFWHRFDQVYLDALQTGVMAGMDPLPDEHIPGLKGCSAFVGVNYYMPITVGARAEIAVGTGGRRDGAGVATQAAAAEATQLGWPVAPEYLSTALDAVAATGLPIYVTENGIATEDERQRISYIARHLERVHAAIAKGQDVRGYFYWSLLDNFEWNEGFRPRFGLASVEREGDYARSIKAGGHWFGAVASTGTVPPLHTLATAFPDPAGGDGGAGAR